MTSHPQPRRMCLFFYPSKMAIRSLYVTFTSPVHQWVIAMISIVQANREQRHGSWIHQNPQNLDGVLASDSQLGRQKETYRRFCEFPSANKPNTDLCSAIFALRPIIHASGRFRWMDKEKPGSLPIRFSTARIGWGNAWMVRRWGVV
jgi:hypothetical protein